MTEWIEIKEETDVSAFCCGFIGVRNHDELSLINKATLETGIHAETKKDLYFFFLGEYGKILELDVILRSKDHVFYWLELPELPGEKQ